MWIEFGLIRHLTVVLMSKMASIFILCEDYQELLSMNVDDNYIWNELYLTECLFYKAIWIGSGKSTLATKIVNNYLESGKRGVICSADDYFYDQRGNYHWDGNRLSEAHEFCKQKSERHMNLVSHYKNISNMQICHLGIWSRYNW